MTHGTSTPHTQHSPWNTEWPAGVIARYLTKAAEISGLLATVDVRGTYDDASYKCGGCGDSTGLYGARRTKELAQGHAEKCRALPRPGAPALAPGLYTVDLHADGRHLTHEAIVTGTHQTEADICAFAVKSLFPGRDVVVEQFTLTPRHPA